MSRGHVSQRRNGKWQYVVDGPRVDGKRRQVTRAGFTSKGDAERALTAVLAGLDTGRDADSGVYVGAFLDSWLAALAENRSPKTMANYRGHVRDVWRPALGHMRLRDLRRSDIERVLSDVATPGKVATVKGRHVESRTPSTVDCYRRTIRAALAVAVRNGYLSTNVAAGPMIAIPPRAPAEIVIWEPEQTAKFLRQVEGTRLGALYQVSALAGLRRAEVCGLRWQDIDDAGLTIRQTLVEVASKDVPRSGRTCGCGVEHTGRMIKHPKSVSGARWVPLTSSARAALKAHKVEQDAERQVEGYRDHGLVFAMANGDPLRPSDVSTEFDRTVKEAGLPRIPLHSLRHGACSLMLAGGVPIEIVAKILGHSTPDVTRKVYAHVMRTATAAQVESAMADVSSKDPVRRNVRRPAPTGSETAGQESGQVT